jgi:hypothetical protein
MIPIISKFLEQKPRDLMGVFCCKDNFGKGIWLCKNHAELHDNNAMHSLTKKGGHLKSQEFSRDNLERQKEESNL